MSDLASWASALSLDKAGEIQWAEEPVPLTVFVQDRRYLGQPPLSEDQYEAVRHAERIYFPHTYASLATSTDSEIALYWSQPCRDVNFLELEWGKGGGKDHTCRVTSLRIAYELLCLPSPQAYYEMPEQDTIHMLNVASNSRQASRAFFKPMRQMVSRPGGWFYQQGVEAIEASNRDRRRSALQGGEAERMVLQDTIRFPKNVEAISGHSDADAQEGLNLILGLADEIDAFPRAEELAKYHAATARGDSSRSAEAIVSMLRSSARTRFPEVFKNIHISWPRYVGSMIQTLRTDAEDDIARKGEVSRFYVSGPKASWEVNPRIQRPCTEHQRYRPGCEACWERCKALFEDDYEKDPARARAMYEAKPSRAINPYFSNTLTIEKAFQLRDRQPLDISYVVEVPGRAWKPQYDFAPWLVPVVGAQYAMHCDLAITGDRAGIALAHVARWEDRPVTGQDEEGGDVPVWETRPVVKVDFLAAYSADARAEPPREIQIRWARLLCLELIRRGFNVRVFTADGFECLSGDTKIPLLDGTTQTMRELEGAQPFWVYSIRDGRIVPGLCTRAWQTGVRADMLEVELDNGERLKATSDHRFMLRSGQYRMAKDLQPGDSLMPLYRRMRPLSRDNPEALYEQVWHPTPDGARKQWRFTHSAVSHYCYGPVPRGSVTHHKNLIKTDNQPGNLVQMTGAAHSALHAEMASGRFERLWADPEWAEAHKARLAVRRRKEMTGKRGRATPRYRHGIEFADVDRVARQCLAEGVKLTWRAVAERLGCDQTVIYARVREAGYSTWKAYRDVVSPPSEQALYVRSWKAARNHKVVAIRAVLPEAVYDLRVEEHHNFATAAGVFVHNSADSRQIMQAQYGIETHVVSTDRASMIKADGISQGEALWRNVRDLAAEARLEIAGPLTPQGAPRGTSQTFYDTALGELLALSRMPNGKIDHPPSGSKDIADALAGAAGGAIYLGGQEDESGIQAYPGGALESWNSGPGNLPEGFVAPDAHSYHEMIDHMPVSLDGIGRPEFGGAEMFGEDIAVHQG